MYNKLNRRLVIVKLSCVGVVPLLLFLLSLHLQFLTSKVTALSEKDWANNNEPKRKKERNESENMNNTINKKLAQQVLECRNGDDDIVKSTYT